MYDQIRPEINQDTNVFLGPHFYISNFGINRIYNIILEDKGIRNLDVFMKTIKESPVYNICSIPR